MRLPKSRLLSWFKMRYIVGFAPNGRFFTPMHLVKDNTDAHLSVWKSWRLCVPFRLTHSLRIVDSGLKREFSTESPCPKAYLPSWIGPNSYFTHSRLWIEAHFCYLQELSIWKPQSVEPDFNTCDIDHLLPPVLHDRPSS